MICSSESPFWGACCPYIWGRTHTDSDWAEAPGAHGPDEGIPDVLVDVTVLSSSANPNVVAEAFSVLAVSPPTAVVQTAVLPAAQQQFQAVLDRAARTVTQ